jgi:imidazolonepropionase
MKRAPKSGLWLHASELLSGEGIRRRDGRRPREADLGRIEDGAIAFAQGKIQWVGQSSHVPRKYLRLPRRDLGGNHAVVPGWIDCHTHLVFAGDRADEFAARCAGATYQEIARKGGGISATVRATRAASERELLGLAVARVREMQGYGTRTIEIKSGYGLDTATELKILRVARALAKRFPEMTFRATYLGAHAVPRGTSRSEYLEEILREQLPQVARARLAHACDVFVDEGYFSTADARRILGRARELGLATRLHADELGNTESAALACTHGALSADHLLKVSARGIRALARSETVAVVLPGTAFYLKLPYAPARKLIDAGARVAIATDFNPGTCMSASLPAMMTLAALHLGMSRAEIFAAVTYNAACALDLQARKGSLLPGLDADLVALPFARFEDVYYRFAWSPPEA